MVGGINGVIYGKKVGFVEVLIDFFGMLVNEVVNMVVIVICYDMYVCFVV